MMMRGIIIAAVALATIALTVLFSLSALYGWAIAIALVGLLWLTEPRHGWRWVPTFALLVFIAVAVVGAMINMPTFWLLTSLAATLVAWDLNGFDHYLDDVTDVRDETELSKTHIRRLGAAVGPGWFAGAVALGVRITFDFNLTLALGLLVIIGLSGVIRYTRRENASSQTDQS